MSSSSSDPKAGGWKLGEYMMQKKLGSGSFGEIYLGQHITSGQAVAIKIVRSLFYLCGLTGNFTGKGKWDASSIIA
jgi:serine/threonine protein kinase